MLRTSKSLVIGTTLALAATAHAETVLLQLRSAKKEPGFGAHVARAGDVDGDGHADVLASIETIGDPANPYMTQGRVYVVSGKDKGVLREYDGDVLGDDFGAAIANAGDVNGDGIDDHIVGAPMYDGWLTGGAGYVKVFSGKDGSVLHTIQGNELGAMFGATVAGAGDVDGDGCADVLVGAWWADSLVVPNCGMARLYSGKTGLPLFEVKGSESLHYVGLALAGVGDLDHDGHADFAIGAPGETVNGHNGGAVRVYSGATLQPLFTFFGGLGAFDDDFGWSIAAAGDIDQDGWNDVAVGTPQQGTLGQSRVEVFSGRNGSVIRTLLPLTGDEIFGVSVDGAGDMNGDEVPDLVVGSPLTDANGHTDCGRMYGFSGKTGGILFAKTGTHDYEQLGYGAVAIGDVDGDGSGDAATSGAIDPQVDPALSQVYLVTYASVKASYDVYGAGFPGTNGVPAFVPNANPVICEPMTLELENSYGQSTVGVLFLGATPIALPSGFGGTLLVNPLVAMTVSIPPIGLDMPTITACNTKLCGFAVYLQAVLADPGAAKGVAFTRGLKLVLGGT